MDALRDLDDSLTMVHLFATLPAESKYDIPQRTVQLCRRLALEWQAYVVRSGALRRVFVSVKGYYFQVGVLSGGGVGSGRWGWEGREGGTTVPLLGLPAAATCNA